MLFIQNWIKMPNEDDLILEVNDNDLNPELDIIDNQLMVINTMLEIEQSPYDDFIMDKTKIIIRAMKIIYTQQKKLL